MGLSVDSTSLKRGQVSLQQLGEVFALGGAVFYSRSTLGLVCSSKAGLGVNSHRLLPLVTHPGHLVQTHAVCTPCQPYCGV